MLMLISGGGPPAGSPGPATAPLLVPSSGAAGAPTTATAIRCPSATLAARFSRSRSAFGSPPPAASTASITRSPDATRTTPGCATAPATWTTSSPPAPVVEVVFASAAVDSVPSDSTAVVVAVERGAAEAGARPLRRAGTRRSRRPAPRRGARRCGPSGPPNGRAAARAERRAGKDGVVPGAAEPAARASRPPGANGPTEEARGEEPRPYQPPVTVGPGAPRRSGVR